MAPLVISVKSWARKFKIDKPFHGTLSSYSLSLMVIHFLQNIHPPILPFMECELLNSIHFDNVIQTGQLQHHLKILIEKTRQIFISSNNLTLGELFFYFIEYYCYRLNHIYINNHISIRKHYTQAPVFKSRLSPPILMIEDPFHYHNTAGSVSFYSFGIIKNVFQETYSSLRNFTFSKFDFEL